MVNSEDVYWECGRRAHRCRLNGDECGYKFERDWFLRAKEVEGDWKHYAEAAYRDGWNSISRLGQTDFSKIPY